MWSYVVMVDLATCMASYTALQKEHDRLAKMLEDNQDQDWETKENQGQDANEQT